MNDLQELLEIAKKYNIKGRYIDIALGKRKLPVSIREAITLYKRERSGK